MKEIEVANKVHPRNILMFCSLGLLGLINGATEFGIYKGQLTKIIFPDPITYMKVVELNQTMLSTTTVNNAIGNGFNFLALGLFVLAAVFMIGMTAGVMGKCD